MKMRYLITAILLYTSYASVVFYNALGRMFGGHSVFSSDPGLTWFGSWQAIAIFWLITFAGLIATAVMLGWGVAEAYDRMKPKKRNQLNLLLRKVFKIVWLIRRNHSDSVSQVINVAGKEFPSLVK